MIKAVIFDFFGVICSDEYWNFVKEDKDMDADFSKLAQAVNLGKMSWKDFVGRIAEETGEDADTVEKMYESQRINPQMIAYIDELHDKYKTALLTNANYDQFNPIAERAHLDKVFDEIVISSRLGIAKPDPRIFEHTLQKLAVQAEEAVFIDDLSKHVNAAKSLGINTILYENFEQMKQDLEKILSSVTNK